MDRGWGLATDQVWAPAMGPDSGQDPEMAEFQARRRLEVLPQQHQRRAVFGADGVSSCAEAPVQNLSRAGRQVQAMQVRLKERVE